MNHLAQRYGERRPVRRIWWVLAGGAALLITLTWMVWVTFGSATIGTLDVTHSYDSSRQEMSITWQVTAPPGTPLACAVQALNEQFQVVGWDVVDIPASENHTQQLSHVIRTVMTPNTGLVYHCWAS